MKKKPQIKKYAKGGNFFEQAGELGLNALRSTVDVPLTTLGLSNVIPDSDYTGLGAEFGSNYSNKVGGTLNKIAPMAANMLVPGSGQLISGVQNIAGQYNPQMNHDPNAPKQYAMGGVAELEKQEVFKTPDGQINSVNGPSHEAGGVAINIPNQTKILSDKLKLGKKTFAELGSKYKTVKEDKILSNDLATPEARATAKLTAQIKQKKLDQLFNTQEQMKQDKLIKYASKLGVKLPQDTSNIPQQFEGGGEYDNTSDIIQNQFDTAFNSMDSQNQPYDSADAINQYNFDKAFANMEGERMPPPKTPMNKSWIEPLVSGVAQNAGNLAYLTNEGKKYDKVDYGKITPKLIDYSQAIKDARMQAAINRNQLRANSGGNAGAYIANQGQLGAQNTANIANIIQAGENTNAGIYNQAQLANQEYKIKGMQDEAANKGAATTNYYKALNSTIANSAGAYMDYKNNKMDANKVKLLNQMFSQYGMDINNPNDWKIIFKG